MATLAEFGRVQGLCDHRVNENANLLAERITIVMAQNGGVTPVESQGVESEFTHSLVVGVTHPAALVHPAFLVRYLTWGAEVYVPTSPVLPP